VAFPKLLLELQGDQLTVQVVLQPTEIYGYAMEYQFYRSGLAVCEVSLKNWCRTPWGCSHRGPDGVRAS
jgi:hypothetical protein